jgi:hypothetical protein
MRKTALGMLSVLAGLLLFGLVNAAVAPAGPPTPLGVAEAKSAAKKYVHSYCNTHNCRGSRVKHCESKTQFRVDCEGLYGKGARDICEFKISVQAIKDRQIRFNIFGVKCEDG